MHGGEWLGSKKAGTRKGEAGKKHARPLQKQAKPGRHARKGGKRL
jgi:hypothetical protein